jgi:hypothetical protein
MDSRQKTAGMTDLLNLETIAAGSRSYGKAGMANNAFRPVRRRRCGRGDFCGKIGPETLASFAPLRETKVV